MSGSPGSVPSQTLAQFEQMRNTYSQAWTATNPQRQQLLERCLSPSFHMTTDHSNASGHGGMQTIIDGFHSKLPGASFKTRSLHAYQLYGKVEWECVDVDGKVMFSGMDYVELAEDGRFVRVVAFFY